MLSVPLRFIAQETPVRRGEPVTVGLPWPRGAVKDELQFRLIGPDESERTLQTRVLDRWPDGSVRWCLFDFLATVDGSNDGYRIENHSADSSLAKTTPVSATASEVSVETQWGNLRAAFFSEFRLGAEVVHKPGWKYRVETSALLALGGRGVTRITEGSSSVRVEESGPVRTRIGFRFAVANETEDEDRVPVGPRVELFGHVDCFPGIPVVRISVTLRNPHSAGHPGGNWDLGNSGSMTIREFAWNLQPSEWLAANVRCSPERGMPSVAIPCPFELRQESSGGANWASLNHVTSKGAVELPYRGYKLHGDGQELRSGLRATPIITAESDGKFIGFTTSSFWENFPQSMEGKKSGLKLKLFPGVTELQGGEQKTFNFSIAFGEDRVTDEQLVWCRSPLICHADPEWYANWGAIPYLTPKATDPNAAYLGLVDQAIEGPDTFFDKREKIDEYGWRHFGDIYGDHEAVGWPGPEPMVSHYNNQYDCVAGFLYQFLRSGDRRWWDLAIPCADHTCDIDIYHTGRDKAAYNRGLFWHTYHYAPADTGTHRSYPKSLRAGPQGSLTQKMDQLGETAVKLKKSYAVGGGPAASHNYNRGLILAYFLTGNPIYRDTAIDLAKFVIAMENPSKTPFRWLSREFTGLATESGGGGYHGPGRASANSVEALLVGHRLTGDRSFLDKAEQLIRRVAHPNQNLERLDLLNAELRWFYTMYLQALGNYLDYKIELGELDRMYAYGRLTLLHYARWMANRERPILDMPEKLQYPNETWAAQDMRKVEVFQFAAKHATGKERELFHERAEWFFRYVERTLTAFETKSLCRPVVLMLNFGWSRAWWQSHPEATAPAPAANVEDFGEWRVFVPQKAIAVKRAKRILAAGAMGFAIVVVAGILWLFIR